MKTIWSDAHNGQSSPREVAQTRPNVQTISRLITAVADKPPTLLKPKAQTGTGLAEHESLPPSHLKEHASSPTRRKATCMHE